MILFSIFQRRTTEHIAKMLIEVGVILVTNRGNDLRNRLIRGQQHFCNTLQAGLAQIGGIIHPSGFFNDTGDLTFAVVKICSQLRSGDGTQMQL